MTVLDVVSGLLLGAGALLLLTGGVGLLRFPDFYTRVHAAGVTDPVAAALILFGLLAQVSSWETAVRLLITLLFLTLTSPTATHILAQAARRDGVPVWRGGDRHHR